MTAALLRPAERLLALFHARGFHAAVVAGLVMMPLVVAAGFATDRPDASAPSRQTSLRGSLDPAARGAAPRP